MPSPTIARRRTASQGLAPLDAHTPLDVVTRLAAVQAQDFRAALWAIGARLPNATASTVEQALADRAIVRTWLMRGTLHLAPAGAVRWMLALTAPRVMAGAAARHRALELDAAVFARSRRTLMSALRGGHARTRAEVLARLEADGIRTTGQRGYHILGQLAQEGLLCFGPCNGTHPTFVLLDEWIPAGTRIGRDAALAELARRYFTGHGPATVRDFAWWSGLSMADARAAVEAAAPRLGTERIHGIDYLAAPAAATGRAAPAALLPAFDEYLIGYKDRDAVLDPAYAERIVPGGNGVFQPLLLVRGRVAGTWKAERTRAAMRLRVSPFHPLPPAARRALAAEAARYGRFLETPMAIELLATG